MIPWGARGETGGQFKKHLRNRQIIIRYAYYMDESSALPGAALETAALLYRHLARLMQRLRAVRPAEGPGLSKLGILSRLHREGPATGSALAAYLGLQPQSMTRLLQALETDGLIQRETDVVDRRQNRIRLTAAGRRSLKNEIAKRRLELAAVMSRVLTRPEIEDLKASAGLLGRIAAALEVPAVPPTAERGQE